MSKSVLDNMKTKEQGFPLSVKERPPQEPPERKLETVGHCPSCGAPVYGYRKVALGEEPVVRYSCQCRLACSGLSMQTK